MTEHTDKDPIELPEYGPAMLALNDRQRKFVVALFDESAPREGFGLWTWAAERAGYSASNPAVLKSQGWRVAHDPKVIAAINEHAKFHVRTLSPEAVRSLRDLLKNPKHRDHMRAIDAVLNRADPVESKLSVAVEQTWKPSVEVTEKVLRRIDELAAKFGLLPSPKVIDAEVTS
jgi:phage terminase small subunit